MKLTGRLQILIILTIITAFNCQISAQSVEVAESVEITQNDLIHPGDLIDVDILGNNEFDWRGSLTPEGFLDGLDFIQEPVFALCKTPEEIAPLISQGYSNILREPRVKVTILDRSNRPPATIFGAIKSEQKFLIKRPVLLNELIVKSGGFTEKSSGFIQILRPPRVSCKLPEGDSDRKIEKRDRFVNTSQNDGTVLMNFSVAELLSGNYNPQIFSGDVITILEASPIYIIGGVVTPKTISTREQMSLSRAIASAGGLAKDANSSEITVFRQEGITGTVIAADYDKIKNGDAEDIILKEFDIVEVGVKGRKKSQLPPVIEQSVRISKTILNLPLTIID